MRFTKMQGAGNDFVMLDATQEPFMLTSQQIRALCDRRYGVGCDQLLVVEKSELPDIDFKYRIFNCSGGEVEMCGNGARCFAVFVRELGLTDKKMIACETVKGIIRPHIEDDGTVTVDMGRPRFEADDVGLVGEGVETQIEGEATLYKITAAGVDNWVSIVSMGNPHAVRLVKDVATDLVGAVGSALQEMPDSCRSSAERKSTFVSTSVAQARRLPAGRGRAPRSSQAFAAAFWTTMCLFTCAAVTFAFAGADRPKTRSTCRVRP